MEFRKEWRRRLEIKGDLQETKKEWLEKDEVSSIGKYEIKRGLETSKLRMV